MKENCFTLRKARSRWYPAETITDADYTDDITLLANTPTQVESLLHGLEQAAGCIGCHVNADKIEYICFNQKRGNLHTKWWFSETSGQVHIHRKQRLIINMRLAKAWTAIDRLSIICKSNLSNEIKRNFFQAAAVSILLYGCTTWALTKRIEKKLDGSCSRMLRVTLNKSWKQHPAKQQLYNHLPPISKTIKIRRTRYAGPYWRSKDELISNVLLWTSLQDQVEPPL